MDTPKQLAKTFAPDLHSSKELIPNKTKFIAELIQDVAQSRGIVKTISDQKGSLKSLLLAEAMPFDTKILGKECLRLLYCFTQMTGDTASKKRSIQAFLQEHHPELLYVRCDVSDQALSQALIELKFTLITTELQFAWDRKSCACLKQVPRVEGINMRLGKREDLAVLKKFAPAFWSNRFRQDRSISREKAVTIYEKWIENALLGKVGEEDEVWVAEIEETIVGFATTSVSSRLSKALGKRVGTPGLIAVREGYRGRGINPALMSTSLLSLLKRVELALAPSHITNLSMIQSELKAGAHLVNAEYIFHKHFNREREEG